MSVQEQILNIVFRQLQGDYSEALTKFSYLGKGADQYLSLVNSPDYLSYEREMLLLQKAVPIIQRIIQRNYGFQIIELGPGDGRKAAELMLRLAKKNNFSYLALDISQEMLFIAKQNQKHLLVDRGYCQCDFNNPEELKQKTSLGPLNRLFLLLGNTMANEVQMKKFLLRLRTALDNSQACLLVGLELIQEDIEKIIREYRNIENRILTIRPLEMIGVNRNDGRVEIFFNQENQRIEEWFIFENLVNISCGNSMVRFSPSTKILLSVTYKWPSNQIKGLIKECGWKTEAILSTKHTENILALLVPIRD